jgi:hypothetical protein
VHKLSRAKILICIKELLACQFAFAVLVIAILVPSWVTSLGVLSEVVRWVSDD